MTNANNIRTPAIFNWSGGKDSALCLYKIMQQGHYEVMCLLTSVSEKHQRISMHGVNVQLLHQQAESIGLPLIKMQMPDMPTMEAYDKMMFETLSDLKTKGAEAFIFGDIFLEDLRSYREAQLSKVNLNGVFPLWKMSTTDLLYEFIDLGFKTVTVCVNEKYLDQSFAGRIIDHDFIKDLPSSVDPCGENGEFHTFVFDGPLFKKPIGFDKGEIVYRKYSSPSKDDDPQSNHDNPFDSGFWFCDLVPK